MKKTYEPIGSVPVVFTDNALYFTHDGGTFEGEGVKGSFAVTVGGAAITARIEGGGTYQCSAKDFVSVAIEHHKRGGKPDPASKFTLYGDTELLDLMKMVNKALESRGLVFADKSVDGADHLVFELEDKRG